MLPLVVVSVLTVLAAVAVVLTRLRLGAGRDASGRARVSRGLLAVHTGAGGAALVVWIVFLALGSQMGENTTSVVGIVAIGLWWVAAGAGLLILVRWLPSKGRHASPGVSDSWSEGPWLSIVAHLGLVVGVIVFTWAYLTEAV